MAVAVFFDEKGRYKGYRDGVNSPDYFGKSDVALNPEGLKDLIDKDVPRRYWKLVVKPLKYVGGNPVMNDVVEMSQAEKDMVDAEILEKKLAEVERRKNFMDTSHNRLFRAFALVVLDEVNRLRKQLGLSAYTIQQMVNAVKEKYDSLG